MNDLSDRVRQLASEPEPEDLIERARRKARTERGEDDPEGRLAALCERFARRGPPQRDLSHAWWHR